MVAGLLTPSCRLYEDMVAIDCDPMCTRALLLCLAVRTIAPEILLSKGRFGKFGKLLRPDAVRSAGSLQGTTVCRIYVKPAVDERHR
jgi:hypothetical protein